LNYKKILLKGSIFYITTFFEENKPLFQ